MIGKKAQQYDNNALDLGNFSMPFNTFQPIEVGNNIEVTDDEPEVIFSLDDIPGAPDAKEIVVESPDDVIKVESDGDQDGWKWEPKTFLTWLQKMFKNTPQHSGHDTTGLEKAISYFEALDREITKAMRTDYKNEIDSAQAERAREQIEEGLARLLDRLEKVNADKYKSKSKKKKAWYDGSVGIVKEGQKSTPINGITITVPLLISRIARVCINGVVSAGHDLEDMFERQAKEYNLDKREKAELSQLLADMNYPMIQDRGIEVGKRVDLARNDNFDFNAQYRG